LVAYNDRSPTTPVVGLKLPLTQDEDDLFASAPAQPAISPAGGRRVAGLARDRGARHGQVLPAHPRRPGDRIGHHSNGWQGGFLEYPVHQFTNWLWTRMYILSDGSPWAVTKPDDGGNRGAGPRRQPLFRRSRPKRRVHGNGRAH